MTACSSTTWPSAATAAAGLAARARAGPSPSTPPSRPTGPPRRTSRQHLHRQPGRRGGGNGGSGRGGALANFGATLSLNADLITHNYATGSTGEGGGVYSSPGGFVDRDAATLIFANHASTSGDDTFGF